MNKVREETYAKIRLKLLYTVGIFFVFLIGLSIPVPFMGAASNAASGVNQNLLNITNVVTGGNYFSPSLFSLGLGPWMFATILLRFAGVEKYVRKNMLSKKTVDYSRIVLMVIMAIIMAISFSSHYQLKAFNLGATGSKILVVIILTAGALAVAWLGNQNKEKGLGGVTMLILYQIVITILGNFTLLTGASFTSGQSVMVAVTVVASIATLIYAIVSNKKELRIHVNKTSIDSGFTGKSYMPIKWNPAGASPIMYGLTLMALPLFTVHSLTVVFPHLSTGTTSFLSGFSVGSPAGFIFYLVLLFALTIFFSMITVDPKQLSENMVDTGEYFDNISPGEPTRRFIGARVMRLALISGVFLVVLTGLPMFFIQKAPNLAFLFALPGTVLIFVGLIIVVQEEVADLLIGTKYSSLFTDEAAGGDTK